MDQTIRPAGALTVLAAVVAACGGADTHEALARESVTFANDLVTILEGITDEASAEAAKTEFRALGQRADAWRARMQAIGEPDDATRQQIEEDLKPEMTPLRQRMMKAMMAIPPELQQVVGDGMSEIMGKLQVPGR